MGAFPSLVSVDDVCFIARRVLAMLHDPRASAQDVGRIIDTVPALADLLLDRANTLLAGRGHVALTGHAIALLGFDRLEGIVRRFLTDQLERLGAIPIDPGLLEAHTRLRYAAV